MDSLVSINFLVSAVNWGPENLLLQKGLYNVGSCLFQQRQACALAAGGWSRAVGLRPGSTVRPSSEQQ